MKLIKLAYSIVYIEYNIIGQMLNYWLIGATSILFGFMGFLFPIPQLKFRIGTRVLSAGHIPVYWNFTCIVGILVGAGLGAGIDC